MAVQVCPRCQRANPGDAAYCHFDGIGLHPSPDGSGAPVFNRLAQEFVFPSGKRCRTFDELVTVCEEDWEAARDFLKKGVFAKYFTSLGRIDLAQSSETAVAQADPDVALTTFLADLPTTRTQSPRLDMFPRRFMLGNMQAGQSKQLQLTISNKGKGLLRGVMKVTEGVDWLRVGTGGENGQVPVNTNREQPVNLQVDTRRLQAAKSYAGKLTVITNGGVVEVPVRLSVVAQPFRQAPFQGVRTPREMAERMRDKPKAAVPLLESGEISRWFSSNNWEFPVRGTLAKGIAGVQQFFEAMGLSKPPKVQASHPAVQLACRHPQTLQQQIAIQTNSRKWVYANVESDSPWLKVLTPTVSGPQQATIGFAVDSRQIRGTKPVEGKLRIVANAGQTLTVPVRVTVQGAPRAGGGFLQPVITMTLVFFLLRLFVTPVFDFYGRGAAVQFAFEKKTNITPDKLTLQSPLRYGGGWLSLPWRQILFATSGELEPTVFDPGIVPGEQPAFSAIPVAEFRHYYVTYLVRLVVILTWWVGGVLGVLIVLRNGGKFADLFFGLIAGSVAGALGAATLACASMIIETVPHFLWDLTIRHGGGLLLLLWTALALACWAGLGAGIGLICAILPPLRKVVVRPVQSALSGLLAVFGMKKWAVYFEGT